MSTTTVKPVIRGWSPKHDNDLLEISTRPHPVQSSPLGVYTFQATLPGTRQSSPAASSPASSNSSLEFQSDPYPEPVRRGDPEWVARPRNPFIIFRCEYSKEHTKEGKRVRRPPGSQAEKTLSKRAAEAWHQLSAEEKNHFKELADKEKEDHAKQHPNYRFRPMKRNATKKKPAPVSRSNSQSVISAPAAVPLVVAPIPRHPPHTATPEPPRLLAQPLPVTATTTAAVKTGRRRSASVPSLFAGQYPFIPGRWAPQGPRLEMKRSRSVMANRPPDRAMSSYATHADGSAIVERDETYNSGYCAPEDFGVVQSIRPGVFSLHHDFSTPDSPACLSPVSQSTSSLADWNGDGSGSHGSPWASSAAVGLEALSLHSSPYAFPMHHDNISSEPSTPYSAADAWATPQYPIGHTVNGFEEPGVLFSHASQFDAPAELPLYSAHEMHYNYDTNGVEEDMGYLDMNDFLNVQNF
ncbi:hypothetical protein DXG03_002996 [Asterophora parasitica]|uniref:HMG box domain-containing protein n=1 Tax=Asterophora parasitica TaxID=117018 RepID=A0A9P7G3F1_9AGAR|nr:hypothetical protein DXG03_002996 [Asterophora parasitica]